MSSSLKWEVFTNLFNFFKLKMKRFEPFGLSIRKKWRDKLILDRKTRFYCIHLLQLFQLCFDPVIFFCRSFSTRLRNFPCCRVLLVCDVSWFFPDELFWFKELLRGFFNGACGLSFSLFLVTFPFFLVTLLLWVFLPIFHWKGVVRYLCFRIAFLFSFVTLK